MFAEHRFSLFRRSDPVGYRSKYDSCLDQIEETYCNNECTTEPRKYSKSNSNRRFTMISTSSRSSLLDISKSQVSSSKRFLAFFQKGIHGIKSKSINKIDNPNFIKIVNEKKYLEALNNVIPIPIIETAIQGQSKTLFHKIPKSNVRPRPLLKLGEETKFVPIHPSLLSRDFNYCVKIISLSPNVYRNCSSGNKYELLLPTGTRSLGHTCHIIGTRKLQEQCPSCNSSQLSLFGPDEQQKHLLAYVFSCSSESERKKYLSVLTRVVKPNLQNERRQEISLSLWIQEAKNVPLKKRYFCEIYLDEILHAKTTTKTMTDILFWGEEFSLCHLEHVNTVTILLWKVSSDSRVKKKKPQQQLMCQVNIETKYISDRNSVEKWYPASYSFNSTGSEIFNSTSPQFNLPSTADSTLTSTVQSIHSSNLSHSTVSLTNNDHLPMIRIKARYQSIIVLPINEYSKLLQFLKQQSVQLLLEIDSYLKVKNKEDLATNVINVLHKEGIAGDFLSDLLFQEIRKSVDDNMILRGNSIASKAIEVYLKLIGEKYLNLILSDFVNRISQGDEDCEVDPQRSKFDFYSNTSLNEIQSTQSGEKSNNSHPILLQRQESLIMNVDMIWAKILSSSIYFPRELKSVFVSLRHKLEQMDKSSDKIDSPSNLCERIVSSCIFLRFICPAILTPSLFGLLPKYPDNSKVVRTFTLVAKCIQSLANFSDLTGSKETYMMFMNDFIENKFSTMQSFLKEISTSSDDEKTRSKCVESTSIDSSNENGLYWENLSSTLTSNSIDISLCLAKLHRQLEEYLQMIPVQKYSQNIEILQSIISEFNEKLAANYSVNEQGSVKFSQSYHDLKTNRKYSVDIEKQTSRDISGTLTKNSSVTLATNQSHHNINDDQILKNVTPSNISFSTETSPTHSNFDNDLVTANYLMTQSMIQERKDNSHIPQPDKNYREQVDKEWKEMVSESNYYHNFSSINDKKKWKIEKSHITGTDLSGYETMNHSNHQISNEKDKNLYEKLPFSSSVFKQSVKKCKQFRRKPDAFPHPDIMDCLYKVNEQLVVSDRKFRSNSIDGLENKAFSDNLSVRNEAIENGSTETITSNSEFRLYGNKHSMNSSISLPSFKTPHNIHELSQSINNVSQANSDQQLHNRIKIKGSMKMSQNLNANSNTRLQQLLLADQKTIELELERVRLMRQICDTSAKPNSNFAWINMNEQGKFIQQNNINGFKQVYQCSNSKQLSVKRYLEVAENILLNCLRNRLSKNCDFQENDNLIIQIFEINQSLQNTLIKNMQGFIFNSKSEKTGYNSISNQSYPCVNNMRIINSNGLLISRSNTSTNTNNTSQLNLFSVKGDSSPPKSSAIIEIVDVV